MKKIQVKAKNIEIGQNTAYQNFEDYKIQAYGVDEVGPVPTVLTQTINLGPPIPELVRTDTIINYPNGQAMRLYKLVGSYYLDGFTGSTNVTYLLGSVVRSSSGMFPYSLTGSITCEDGIGNTFTAPLQINTALIAVTNRVSGAFLRLSRISEFFMLMGPNNNPNSNPIYFRSLWNLAGPNEAVRAMFYYEYSFLVLDSDTVTFI